MASEIYTGDVILRDAAMLAGSRQRAVNQLANLNLPAAKAAAQVASAQAVAALTAAVGNLATAAMEARRIKEMMAMAEDNAAFQRERIQRLDEMERKKMEAIIEHNKRMDQFALQNAQTQLGLAAYGMLSRQKMLSYDLAVRWAIFKGMSKLQAEKLAATEIRRRAAETNQRVMNGLKSRLQRDVQAIQYATNVIREGPRYGEAEAATAAEELRNALEDIKAAYRDALATAPDDETRYLMIPQLKTHFVATMSDVAGAIDQAMRSANLQQWSEAVSLKERLTPDFINSIVATFAPSAEYVKGREALTRWFDSGIAPSTADFSSMFYETVGVSPIDEQIGLAKSAKLDNILMQPAPMTYPGLPSQPRIMPSGSEVRNLLQQAAGAGQTMFGE